MSSDNKKAMVPGRRYKIVLDDCCIEGYVIATFLRWDFCPEEEGEGGGPDDYDCADAIFDIGQIGPGWGKWSPEELEDSPEPDGQNPAP